MTKKEAWARFQDEILPSVWAAEGTRGPDRPMRAEAWNNYTDALCKEGAITLKQYESWTHPRGLGS